MKIDDALVESILKLARLGLPREEYGKYRADLQQILDYVGMLNELDLDAVGPVTACGAASGMLRDDEESESVPRESLLANAPDRSGAFFKVPGIIGRTDVP
jgi:aspartyl-tRNA(Asn)/glutamyl-tRNA(Gln) amidotransferase subunit C